MNTLSLVKNLTRPKTLIASMSPVLLATSFGLKKGYFDFIDFSLLFLCALFLQILANVANDYFDGVKGADNNLRVGPTRVTGSGLIGLSQIRQILFATAFVTLLFAIFLAIRGGPIFAFMIGMSLVTAILYTAGPFPLAYKGLAEPFALTFFGPIPFCFASYLLCQKFYPITLLMGFLPGIYSLILITINNLRDVESDKVASKNTLIVRFGRPFGKKMILFAILCLAIISMMVSFYFPKFIYSLILLPEIFSFYKKIDEASTPLEFAKMLKPTSELYITHTLLWIGFIMI
jgi:1,4-dihydroxy-2-naphthoate octaprenyltransferase